MSDFDQYNKRDSDSLSTMRYEHELAVEFDEWVNEIHEEIEMFGVTYTPANILKSNSVNYRSTFLEWLDSNEWDEVCY